MCLISGGKDYCDLNGWRALGYVMYHVISIAI